MRRALLLARRGWARTAPNPMVGAVVVRDGVVVGEGWHAEYGGPHAEVMALERAGASARGADLYVTLEPCNHLGKTPPCSEAVIAAGVRRVIVAVADPNPLAGGGIARLRQAGLAVTTGVEAAAAEELNAAFLFAHRHAARPFVTLKLAVSLDGMLAPGDRTRRQLTGPEAMKAVHRLRAGVDAVAVGTGTVWADDPQLTVRAGRRPRVAPTRVVFGTPAHLPLEARLVRSARKVPTWLMTAARTPGPHAALEDRGVRVLVGDGLPAHLGRLRAEGIGHVLVEGGARLAGAFLTAGLVDRLVIFQAPVLLGAGALPAFGAVSLGSGLTTDRWRVVERRAFGEDQMTVYAPASR